MPTPPHGYWLNGKRVPSVSTILGNLGWGGDALINWAVNITREGGDHNQVRDEAAAIGTCTHAMIDAHLNGNHFEVSDYPGTIIDRALPPYHAFRRWLECNPVDIIESEFPLVSSALRYGGTPDYLVKMGREVVLLDAKTSNWLMPKMILQVVAYLDLIAECKGIQVDRAIVLRVGKDGTFSTMTVEGETIRQGREAFYHLLQLHRLKSPLEAVTKAVNKPGAIPKSAELTIMGEKVA